MGYSNIIGNYILKPYCLNRRVNISNDLQDAWNKQSYEKRKTIVTKIYNKALDTEPKCGDWKWTIENVSDNRAYVIHNRSGGFSEWINF